MIRVGSRVHVEGEKDEVDAKVIGFRSGDDGEDFRRVDVQLPDGRRWVGCHPKHVRRAVA